MTALNHLFQPIKIGSMEVKNRLVMPPMCTRLASVHGEVTDTLIAYYVERARGGAGLVMVEYCYIDEKESKAAICQLGVQSDHHITGLRELAAAIKSYGARAVLQIAHGGRQSDPGKIGGRKPVAPSEIPDPLVSEMLGHPNHVRALSIDEAEEVIESFVEAARRARDAGFDGVEIHGAHGYLLSQFLSPFSNHRTDLYGGDLEGRSRFPLEIARRTRKKLGPDYPIFYRLSADEFVRGGLTLDETRRFARMLEQAGVNCVDVSAGAYSSMHRFIMPAYYPNGYFVYLAKGIKEAVSVPVIAVGAINEPLHAEEIIAGGAADMVAMGRALIADPYLPKKAFEGRFEDIRTCIRCNDGCINRFFKGWTIRCAVNPVAGREKHYAEIPPARVRRRVMVIGGGPAGMQAAITARRRGHEVALYEKSDRLGGLLNIAAIPDFKQDLRRFRDHLISQVRQMQINVVYNREVDRQLVEAERPDVVVIATGSRLHVPDVATINRGNMVNALDVYSGGIQTGQNVLVVGAGLVGSETALILARQGKKVTLMDRLEKIAFDVEPLTFMALTELLDQAGVEIRTGLNIEAVTETGVMVSDKGWNRFTIEADTVVNAMGLEPNQELLGELEGSASVVFAVGDCYKPRDVGDAVHEAFSRAVGLEPGQDLSRDMGSAADISFMGDDFYYEPNIMAGVSYGGYEERVH